MVLISGMFWCTNDAGFFILINDYVVYNVGLSEYEAAFGITLLGKAVWAVALYSCTKTLVAGHTTSCGLAKTCLELLHIHTNFHYTHS